MGREGDHFPGTERFEILSRLGQGGMGVVYQAFDRERKTRVALKVIRKPDPSYLVRFKREFRLVQDLDHPNLVSLGEFIENEGQWFYTMELVDGIDLLTYVLDTVKDDALEDATLRARPTSFGVASTKPVSDESSRPSAPSASTAKPKRAKSILDPRYRFNEGALRSCLVQVVQGLCELHRVGRVHRDIKPSNILVTVEERVVILDFGLVVELDNPDQSTSDMAVGTFAYMAPEQYSGAPVTGKADWYSVGVILYEALTGSRPFCGSGPEIMLKKQTIEPPAPKIFFEEIPDDLSALCVDLLRIDPAARPSGVEILRRLGIDSARKRYEPWVNALPRSTAVFVGREQELGWFKESLEKTLCGVANSVLVCGPSGVGKTALVTHFAQRVQREQPEALVFTGRCHQHESVPYKAFDGVFDQLSHWMKRLDFSQAASYLPRNAALLAKAFPVLQCVEAVANAPLAQLKIQDPQELRSRVFRCVREFFDRMTERRPVILVIDDLQWADTDSLAMLKELTALPDPPSVMLLATARMDAPVAVHAGESVSAEAEHAPFLGALHLGEFRRIDLQPLSLRESRELATQLIDASQLGAVDQALEIAQESGGYPLFIDTLVRHFASGEQCKDARLEEALRVQILRLGSDERRLLALTAIAGFPITQRVLAEAAELSVDFFAKSIKHLQTARLVRTTGQRQTDLVETYHDRIREAVLQILPIDARRPLHLRMARALENGGACDPEKLCRHWHEAGVREKTARSAVLAGDRAMDALAFDHASEFYHLAIGLGPVEGLDFQATLIKLGEALANSGKGAEAATIYHFAATRAELAQALELKRRAAEQLLVCGHYDKGLTAFRAVFAELGLKFPATHFRAFCSLLGIRIWMRIRGFGFKRRNAIEITDLERTRIDACWAATKGLGGCDVIRGQFLQTWGLLLALRAGDPYRIARALAVEIASLRVERPRAVKLLKRLFEQAEVLAEESRNFHAKAMVSFSRGMTSYLGGRRHSALHYFEEAQKILRAECRDVAWELSTITALSLDVLAWTGRWTELCSHSPRACREAQERGDLYSETLCRVIGTSFVELVNDAPSASREEIERTVKIWTTQGFHVQHALQMRQQAFIDLYEGRGVQALQRVLECWPKLRWSFLLRVPVLEVVFLVLRATAYVAAAVEDRVQRAEYLREAQRDAKRLRRLATMGSEAMAELILAGAANLRGETARALQHLEVAERGFVAEGLEGYANACLRRRGQLRGGAEGAQWAGQADRWFFSQSVINPLAIVRMLAPGFAEGEAERVPATEE